MGKLVQNPRTKRFVKADGEIGKTIIAAYKDCHAGNKAKYTEKTSRPKQPKKKKTACKPCNMKFSTRFQDKVVELERRYGKPRFVPMPPVKKVSPAKPVNVLVPRKVKREK